MSALTVDPVPGNGQGWDDLVRIWEETDAPEGCKVEIIEGIVTVSPPPSKDHNTTAALLQRRLYTVIPEDWEIYQTLGVSVPGRAGLYIPDLVVVPRAAATRPGNRVLNRRRPGSSSRSPRRPTPTTTASARRTDTRRPVSSSSCSSTPGTPAVPPPPCTGNPSRARTGCWTRWSTGRS